MALVKISVMVLVIAIGGASECGVVAGASPEAPISVSELLRQDRTSIGDVVYVSGSVRRPYGFMIQENDCSGGTCPTIALEIDTQIIDRPDVRELVGAAIKEPLASGKGARAVVAVKPYFAAKKVGQNLPDRPLWLNLVSVYSVEK